MKLALLSLSLLAVPSFADEPAVSVPVAELSQLLAVHNGLVDKLIQQNKQMDAQDREIARLRALKACT